MKLYILVPKYTGRVHYIFDLLFGKLLGVDYEMMVNRDDFVAAEGAKLIYGQEHVGNELFVKSINLLFERNVHLIDVEAVSYEGLQCPFPVYGKDLLFPFDVFAASFFLVSRYEEYLPQVRDEFDRFKAESSWMYENGMLQKPLVNIWAMMLGDKLKAAFPDLAFKPRKFSFVPTYDIDSAWAYRNKGIYRTIGAFLRNLSLFDFDEIKHRHQVLRGKCDDPFDSFDFQFELQKEFKLNPVYFILCGDYGENDKNVSIHNDNFRSLIKRLDDHADVGIHPSFASYLDLESLRDEIGRLSDVLHRPVTKSRQHFLRLNLPQSYQKLISLDISDDYTMGYASQVGFRAGIADSFLFYDLENDMVSKLVVHPFAAMDGTMRDYLGLGPKTSFKLLKHLVDEVKAVNGTFIYLTHNETLGGEKRWKGWAEMYRNLLDYALQ